MDLVTLMKSANEYDCFLQLISRKTGTGTVNSLKVHQKAKVNWSVGMLKPCSWVWFSWPDLTVKIYHILRICNFVR